MRETEFRSDGNRHFEVIHTPGHEPAHICLRDSRTGALFSGDHILPRITPFVGYDEIFEDAWATSSNRSHASSN